MTRYFDPICQHMHNWEDLPKCPRHGVNHSSRCVDCRRVADQTPCGGGQS